MRVWLLGMLVIVAMAAGLGSRGEAASLRTADPPPGSQLVQPPERVRLVYPAPVEEPFLVLEVIGPDGGIRSREPRIDPGDPAAVSIEVEGTGPGPYTVRYGALTEDGNVLGGHYVVGVGGPPPASPAGDTPVRGPPQAVLTAGRMLLLTGPILLLGAVVLRWLALAPAWRSGGVSPPGPVSGREERRRRTEGAVRAAAGTWWWVASGGTASWAAGVIVTAAGFLVALRAPVGDTGQLLTDTRAGTSLIASAACVLIALAGLLLLWRRDATAPDPGVGWAIAPGGAAAAALLIASWSGHASSGSDRVIGIGADALHNWGAALWLGGLASLAAWLPRARSRAAGDDGTALGAAAVVRFSSIAIVAVSVLVVTGLYRALAELPSAADVLESGWGRALVVKLALFVLLLALGAYNRLVLHPRLERAALGLADSERGASRTLVLTTGSELVLGAGVMLAAAFLVVLPVPT